MDEGRSQSGILLPLMCCLVVDTVTEGLDGNGCYTLGYALSSLSHRFFWKFVYGTTVVRQKSAINLSTEGSAPGSTFYETRWLS